MGTDTTAEFAKSLADADVACTRVESAKFEDVLNEVIDTPAVGVHLDIEGVTLDNTDVQTPPTPRLLQEAETGVTRVHGGIVEHGSLVIQSDAAGTEPVALYPQTHVGVVRASDLHADVKAATTWLGQEFRANHNSAIIATGPSATADMGELVQGVHGPQDVHAIVITDR